MNTNRDPISPAALAAAVTKYMHDLTCYEFGKPDEDDIAQFDTDFEKVLLTQGVISPDDSIDEFYFDNNEAICVILTGGIVLMVWANGNVTES